MRGQGGDSQIQAALTYLNEKAAVLRRSTLGNIHVGKNFNPGNDRGLEFFRNVRELAQHAVNADTNGCRLTLRLDVDIARSLASGSIKDG